MLYNKNELITFLKKNNKVLVCSEGKVVTPRELEMLFLHNDTIELNIEN